MYPWVDIIPKKLELRLCANANAYSPLFVKLNFFFLSSFLTCSFRQVTGLERLCEASSGMTEIDFEGFHSTTLSFHPLNPTQLAPKNLFVFFSDVYYSITFILNDSYRVFGN